MKTIYLAGGCFWGTEHYISQFEGVINTVAGYANGFVPAPEYEQVYTDETGHAECVEVTYDPEIISLSTICRLFFRSINPLLKNRQGEDFGTRYRTGIYWTDEDDRTEIEEVYNEIERRYDVPLLVEKSPLVCFYPAEEYHQDYLVKNPDGYCHISIETLSFARKYAQIIKELRAKSDEEKKTVLPRFFKTGKGEYGEGDRFIGVVVPDTRKVVKKHSDASYKVLEALMESEWHECRLCALLILIEKYKADPDPAVDFYLNNTKGINNWDLVDLSAPYILGDFLADKTDRGILYVLASSDNIWEQRISVVSTLMLIRKGQSDETFRLASIFMDTPHDLIQKAVGWMLREAGKRDIRKLKDFLDEYGSLMPRTMLRYAIEKLPPDERKTYLDHTRKNRCMMPDSSEKALPL